MKELIMCCFMCACIAPAQAQLLKKLKDKVNQSTKNVTTRVKVKAETVPDRIIDHTATKVETKAESKIAKKENKANSEVDKKIDKVDSVKLRKQKTEILKDSVANSALLMQSIGTKKNRMAGYKAATSFCNEFHLPFTAKLKHIILNEFYNKADGIALVCFALRHCDIS